MNEWIPFTLDTNQYFGNIDSRADWEKALQEVARNPFHKGSLASAKVSLLATPFCQRTAGERYLASSVLRTAHLTLGEFFEREGITA